MKTSNLLIRALPHRERISFTADLLQTHLRTLDVLAGADNRSARVHFSTGAVVSLICISNGSAVDVRGIGIEGMLGAEALRATENGRYKLVCQIGGSILSMPMATFARHYEQHVGLRRIIAQYSTSVVANVTQSVACNGLHSIAQRCARWLLTTGDRVGSNEFDLTHELLARMLGVRRAGVSVAVHRLQRIGIIQYRLGKVQLISRARLEIESCECYRFTANETRRIFRLSPASSIAPRRRRT
jgi:CRP-like cAMP-binding protein